MSVSEYLQQLKQQHPAEARFYSELALSHEKQLWFQVSQLLDKVPHQASLQAPQQLVQFWARLVQPLEEQLPELALARFVCFVARRLALASLRGEVQSQDLPQEFGQGALQFVQDQAQGFSKRLAAHYEQEHGVRYLDEQKALAEQEQKNGAEGGQAQEEEGLESKENKDSASSSAAAAMVDDSSQEAEEQQLKEQDAQSFWKRPSRLPLPRAAEADENALLLVLLELVTLRGLTVQSQANVQNQLAPSLAAAPDSQKDWSEEVDLAKDRLDDIKERMDLFLGILDSQIHAAFYQASALLARLRGDTTRFFQHSLLHLDFCQLSAMPAEEQQQLARQLALAALLGPTIYNFAELLQHPILQSLAASGTQAWLVDLLQSFSRGEVTRFQEHLQAALQGAVPEDAKLLRDHQDVLLTKLRILALLELVFGTSERSFSFAQVQERTQVPAQEVELVLLKAFAHGVLRGEIDQVQETVRVDWIQPRVLSPEQMAGMRDRLNEWSQKVADMADFMEKSAPELLATAETRLAGLGM